MAVPPMRALYGVPIHEAAASGDLERMKQMLEEAEQYLEQHGDVSAALEHLKIEIARFEAQQEPVNPTPIMPLYAVPIHRAIASGDLAQMKALASQAETHVTQHGHVAAALESLKLEIAKLEGSA